MNKSIKKVILLALIMIFALGMVACGDKGEETTVYTVGIDDQFPPMGFKDENGEIVGFDIDIAKAVAEQLGIEIQFQPIDWTMKETELNNGNIDFIWNGYTITKEREEKVGFSTPYLENKQIIITMADSAINKKSDLKGKKVGAQNQSSAVDAMMKDEELYESFDGKKAITFEDNNQALMDLEAKRVDAVVVDEVVARYYIQAKGADKYKILEENFGDELYGIGLRKDDTELIEKVNTALKELKESGKLKDISVKWFGEDIIVVE